MPDDTRTYLGVFDFGADPVVVTELVGFQPSEAYAKGDMHTLPSGQQISRPHSAWRLDSPLPATAHVDDQIEALLDMIEPRAQVLREVAARYEVGICCRIYYADFSPGIHVSELTVKRLAAMGLSLDFDLYFLPDEEPIARREA